MGDDKGQTLIETTLDGGIAVVQLNRPPANALTADFLDEIEAAFRRFEADTTTRAVVLKGYEKVFSGGMDLKALPSFDADTQRAVVDGLNRCYGTLYAFSEATGGGGDRDMRLRAGCFSFLRPTTGSVARAKRCSDWRKCGSGSRFQWPRSRSRGRN